MITKAERRRRDGYSVKDWKAPTRFVEHCFPIIRDRVSMFLDEYPSFAKRSTCVFQRGCSAQSPPAVEIEFHKSIGEVITVLTQKDETLILTFMYRLIPMRMNLKFVQTAHTLSSFAFKLVVRTYYPYQDKQQELDIFGRFGGNASPPDISMSFAYQMRPYEKPYYPPKGIQRILDLGPFCCGNSMQRLDDIHPPKVIFSDLDPGEIDDVPFEYPPLPEKMWQQLEFDLPPGKKFVSPLYSA